MKSLGIIILILTGLCSFAQAQIRIVPKSRLEAVENPVLSSDSAILKFEKDIIVAEKMNEDSGVHDFVYRFENSGTDSISISRIVSSCSCAAAFCHKKTFAPGESGEVLVRYNPKGHPGRFERKFFVYTGSHASPSAVLRLRVVVENGKDLFGIYPVAMGRLRLRRTDVEFVRGKPSVEKCICINASDVPVRIDFERAFMPACLKAKAEPQILKPGEEGALLIEYIPSKESDTDRMKVILKGLGVPPGQSTINVNLK